MAGIHLLAFLLLCTRLSVGDDHCQCRVLCASELKRNNLSNGYYYNSNNGCVQLTSNCSLSHSECVFDSLSLCQSSCEGCDHSPFGCCPDGSRRFSDGHCGGDIPEAQAPNESFSVRWDLISMGVVGSLLVLSVLLIGGVGLYYKHKYRQRKRSRYIHEVLQMYDDSSDSLSDTSIDDNPESNNLFEHL